MQPSSFELKVNATTAGELSALVNSLARQFGVKLDEVQSEIVAEAEPEVAEEAPKKEEAPKAKRGKKPKDEAGLPSAVVEGSTILVEETAPETQTYTKQDIADACQSVSTKINLQAAKDILAQFTSAEGEACRKISQVQESDYAAFVAKCEQAVG